MVLLRKKLTCNKTPVLSGMHSRYPAELSEGQNFGRSKRFQIFGLRARIFGVTAKTNLTGLPKLHSMWSEKLLEQNDFYFKKNTISNPFPEIHWKSSGLLAKISTNGVKLTTTCPQALQTKPGRSRKAFHVYRGTFWGEKFVTNQTLLPFGQKGKSCGFLRKQFYQICQNSSSCFEKNILRQRVFFRKKINLTLFADFEWRNSGRWQTFSTRVWKQNYNWPEEHFEKNLLRMKMQFFIFPWFFRGNIDLQENSRFVRKAF